MTRVRGSTGQWALRLLWLAVVVSLATAQEDTEERLTLRTCGPFFHDLRPALEQCDRALDAAVLSCPQQCQPVFTNMPPPCVRFIGSWLMPSNLTMPAAMANEVAQGKKQFSLCDLLYCRQPVTPGDAQRCTVPVSLLRLLDFYKLEALAYEWAAEDQRLNSVSNFTGTKVAVTVIGVVVGNLLVTALIAGFIVWRRRRRRQQQALEQGQELGAAPAAAPGDGGQDVAKLERGDLEMDSVDEHQYYVAGAIAGKPGAVFDIAAATALRRGTLAHTDSGGAPSTPAGGAAAVMTRGPSSDGASSDGRIRVGALPSGLDSAQGVAAIWAAATQGAVAGWHGAPAQPQSVASGAASVGHMQADEQEMMQLSAAPSGETGGPQSPTGHGPRRSLADDPLLSWVASQMPPSSSGGTALPTQGSDPPSSGGRSSGEGAALSPLRPAASGAPLGPAMSRGLSTRSTAQRLDSGLVDLTPWQLNYAELDVQRPLGEGSFGKVYLAKWRETLVAVKLLVSTDDASTAAAAAGTTAGSSSSSAATRSLSSPTIETLTKEAGLMAALRHPNIVQFIGVCTAPPGLVTEYCAKGSLLDVIRGARSSESAAASLTWVRRLSMALDAAKGMLCLHAHAPPIIHRDLKSPNLLVDSAWRVKVADFNLSKLLEASASATSTGGAMNPRWLAPEILTGGGATAASDVFSFGVVLHELLTWQLPWNGANLYQLVFTVSQGERLPIPGPDDLPGPDQLPPGEYDAYVALIRRCWAQSPTDRPTFGDVIVELRAILSRTLAANTGYGGPPSQPPSSTAGSTAGTAGTAGTATGSA